MTTVGFAGLGIMGRAMALNLISAGFDTIVWNRTAAKTVDLAARGAAVATSASELASRCDVVMMCVSDTSDVEEVVFGEQGWLRDSGRMASSSTTQRSPRKQPSVSPQR